MPSMRRRPTKKRSPWWRRTAGFTRTYEIQYHGGDRYPHLERDPAQPDLLSDTLRPLTGAAVWQIIDRLDTTC